MPEKPPHNKKPKKKSRLKRFFIWCGVLLLLLGALGAGVFAGAWFWVSQDLPQIQRLADYRPPAVTQVLASDGSLMAEYKNQLRYVVPLSEIPRHVRQAFVAAEDGNFYQHGGVDILGIARAAWVNFQAGRVRQGASTITQQVARLLLLTPHQTYVRKAKEAILAYRMENYLTKDEILYIYLNHVYLGHGAHGVEAASYKYFGKRTKDLDIAEAAFLAGLLKAPSRYSPIRHPRRARTRQLYVIGRMQAEGFISQAQAEKARNRQLDVVIHRKPTVAADYYKEYVRKWLEERFGRSTLYNGGLTVYTACDPALTMAGRRSVALGLDKLTRRQGFRGPVQTLDAHQVKDAVNRPEMSAGFSAGQTVSGVVVGFSGKEALMRMGGAKGRLSEKDVAWTRYRNGPGLKVGDVVYVRLDKKDPKDGWWRLSIYQEPVAQAALLAVDNETGRVRVMIGGRDFKKSQYNRAVQARRQPGSAFKPFIFAAALDKEEQGWTPVSVVLDSPVVYDDPSRPGKKWKPRNYEKRFYGPTTLRTALEHSRNVVTVKLLSQIGIQSTIDYARKFGITSQLSPNLSLALGTSGISLLEMTGAYSVFANHGQLIEPVVVEKVLDRNGDVLYQAEPRNIRIISPQTAYLITYLLKGVVKNGTGRMMKALKRPVAGKTGTSNDLRDALFLGFSPQLTCGVWVGQDDNQPLGRKETGARAAGPIWLDFMGQALKDLPAVDFTQPKGVVFARVNTKTGKPVAPGQSGGYFEVFKEGTAPVYVQQDPTRPEPAKAKPQDDFFQAETFAPEAAVAPAEQENSAPQPASN